MFGDENILHHVKNLEWVGSLSLEDADILAEKSSRVSKVLEYGSGGSTLIFSQCISRSGVVVCLETSEKWERLVKERLSLIEHKTSPVKFILSRDVKDINLLNSNHHVFDLIFVDGESGFKNNRNLRSEFSLLSWKLLKAGGEMLFHDTRRKEYFNEMISLFVNKKLEIEKIDVNIIATNGRPSNITSIKKREKIEDLNDFQSIEELREDWTFGGSQHQEFIVKNGLYSYKKLNE